MLRRPGLSRLFLTYSGAKWLLRTYAVVVSFLVLASLPGCGPSDSPDSHVRILQRALGGEPATLDPGAAADTFSTSVLVDLYEGLTAESADGRIIPGLAESWSVDPSGTVYTFRLRQSARWSNGEQVQAQDFVSTWRRDIDSSFASASADNLRFIAHATSIMAGKEPVSALGVSAPEAGVLVVKLERPTPFFPQILAHPTMYPVFRGKYVVTHDPQKWISNGPYILSRWQPATGIDLKPNPYYWGRSGMQVKRVRYQFIAGDAAQYAAYRAGELDMTDTVPANALEDIRKERPGELVMAPFLATAYYGFNLTDKRLSNRDLRQALTMAIDRKRLVNSLGFGQVAAFGFVPPGTANYSPQSWDWAPLSDAQRIAEAKRLFAKAGYSQAVPLNLRILINENEVIKRTALLIGAMWKEYLGVEIEIEAEEYKVFLQTRFDKTRWDVARLAWNADFNDASNFLEVLRTKSSNNDVGYSNASVDAFLGEAEITADIEKRRLYLQSAEKHILDDYPIIPLYFFVSKRLVKPYLHGVQPNPLNHVPSRTLSLDP